MRSIVTVGWFFLCTSYLLRYRQINAKSKHFLLRTIRDSILTQQYPVDSTLTQKAISVIKLSTHIPGFHGRLDYDSTHLSQSRVKFDSNDSWVGHNPGSHCQAIVAVSFFQIILYGNIVYLGRNTWEQISENMKYSPDSPNESRQATSKPFLRRTQKFSTEPEPEATHKQNRRRGQPAGRQRMAKRRGRLAGSVGRRCDRLLQE